MVKEASLSSRLSGSRVDKQCSIVVVNWNSGSQLASMMDSIERFHGGFVSSVVLVDNGSTDDSMKEIVASHMRPFQVKVLVNGVNRGFAAACNQGATMSRSEYVLFLNPDSELYENSLVRIFELMADAKHADVGIAGIQLIDEEGCVARSCGRFPTVSMFAAHTFAFNRLERFRHISMHMSEWPHDSTRDVDQVIGAFFLVRRSLFVDLGGFDERFFVYFEELDFSLRARQRGYRSVYLSEAQAFHAGGGTSRQVKAHRMFYSLRSRLLYGFKHFTRPQAWMLVGLTTMIEPVTRCLLAIYRLNGSDVVNTVRAYGMLFSDLPNILRTIRSS